MGHLIYTESSYSAFKTGLYGGITHPPVNVGLLGGHYSSVLNLGLLQSPHASGQYGALTLSPESFTINVHVSGNNVGQRGIPPQSEV